GVDLGFLVTAFFSSLTGLILVIFAPIFLNPEFTSKPQLIAIAIVGSFAGVRLFPWIFEKMGITLQEDKTLANQEIDDKLNENTDTKK
ncbi:MAG: hypothetical protein R3267_10865, partial [Paenisporosarcina sp.]|nr:hypothetical protein [Paenisporosarcina sp.]